MRGRKGEVGGMLGGSLPVKIEFWVSSSDRPSKGIPKVSSSTKSIPNCHMSILKASEVLWVRVESSKISGGV